MIRSTGAHEGWRWSQPLHAVGGRDWRPGVAAALARMQKDAMRARFPGMRLVLDLPWVTVWEGDLRPLSTSYRVRIIDHRGMDDGCVRFAGRWPVVRVLYPALTRREAAPDEVVPHLFGDHDDPAGAHMCLFYPDGIDWTDEMLLADSIVPWAAEWLFYYEMWHVIGAWGGPEAPHGPLPRRPGPAAVTSHHGRPQRRRRVDGCTMRGMPYLLSRLPVAADAGGSARLAA